MAAKNKNGGDDKLCVLYSHFTVLLGLVKVSCPSLVRKHELPLFVMCEKFMMMVYEWNLFANRHIFTIPLRRKKIKQNEKQQLMQYLQFLLRVNLMMMG